MPSFEAARIPYLIYGTAWKKDRTRALVKQALLSGFQGIDTAAQPKHYHEELVGQGIRDAIKEGGIKREDLYVSFLRACGLLTVIVRAYNMQIQTKFTSVHGQDPKKMPYDSRKSIMHQVESSVKSSLHNFQLGEGDDSTETYIDCLVLHSPFPSMEDTQQAWRAMESHVPKRARKLGLSNIYEIRALRALYEFAQTKPSVVQNRFYTGNDYDKDIRAFCVEKGIRYQSFWTLTGNPNLLQSNIVASLANEAGVSKPVGLYALVIGLGNTSVLDGTSNHEHMQEDLAGVSKVQQWSEASPRKWDDLFGAFQRMLTGSAARR